MVLTIITFLLMMVANVFFVSGIVLRGRMIEKDGVDPRYMNTFLIWCASQIVVFLAYFLEMM